VEDVSEEQDFEKQIRIPDPATEGGEVSDQDSERDLQVLAWDSAPEWHMPALPKQTGCYVWLPTGCPSRSLSAQNEWKKDFWGEKHRNARLSTLACKSRKFVFDQWCGVQNTVAVHVNAHEQDDTSRSQRITVVAADPDHLPEGAPATPRGTGCFVWLPSGCKNSRFEQKSDWKRDKWGEDNMGTGESVEACSARNSAFNGWCGVKDAVMLYVSPQAALSEDDPASTEVALSDYASEKDVTPWPAGAPADPERASVADVEGFLRALHADEEKPTAEDEADSSSTGPSSAVPQHAASGAEGSLAVHPGQGLVFPPHLAAKVPELPKTTGCYVWLPSGCLRNQLDAKNRWRRDFWGEANRNAKFDASACKSRKDAYNDWCGVFDAVTLHAAAPPEHSEGELIARRQQ